MESQPCRNSHIIYWFSLGEAYMVIKRVSSNQMPLNQLIRGSLKYNPPPRPPSPMFNQRPQPGWEVPNNSLSAIVSYWVHKTGSLAGGKDSTEEKCLSGPTQLAQAPQAATLLSLTNAGLEVQRLKAFLTALQTTTRLQGTRRASQLKTLSLSCGPAVEG